MTNRELSRRFEGMVPDLAGWARSYRVPVADLLAHAWQHLARASDPARCTVATLAYYASKRCKQHRHRGCIMVHPATRNRRVPFDESALYVPGPDHTEAIAEAELWAAWTATLRPREREILGRLGNGQQACQVAAALGISPGRLSQIRKQLRCAWEAFRQ